LNVLPTNTPLTPDQTNSHPIHSLQTNTIAITSISWHPTEPILATTLSSGALLLTRIGDRSDGEKDDRRAQGIPGDLVISNVYDEYEEYSDDDMEDTEKYDMSYEDSYASRRGDEMALDEED
jgi:hypothetical protein